MDGVGVLLAILLWLVGIGVGLLRMRQSGGRTHIVTWLALTAVTMSCEFLVAFITCHALLFTLGTGAATVGLVASVVVLGATPVIWAIVLGRRSHHQAAHG
jgi:hypothetical protein